MVMIGFKIKLKMFFIFVLLIGVEVDASRMDRCMEMVNFEGKLGSIIKLEQEEQLDIMCTNVSSFFECVEDIVKDETKFNLREVASIIKGTDAGKGPVILVDVADLVEEICTNGSKLLESYNMNNQCFQEIHNKSMVYCENQAKGAYKLFKESRTDRTAVEQQIDEHCVFTAYHLGCLGAAVKEKCGDQSFRTYKNVVWTIGFFKCGIRTSDFAHILKIPFKSRAHYKYLLPR